MSRKRTSKDEWLLGYNETRLTDDPHEPDMEEKLEFGFAAMSDDRTENEERILHDPPESLFDEDDECNE